MAALLWALALLAITSPAPSVRAAPKSFQTPNHFRRDATQRGADFYSETQRQDGSRRLLQDHCIKIIGVSQMHSQILLAASTSDGCSHPFQRGSPSRDAEHSKGNSAFVHAVDSVAVAASWQLHVYTRHIQLVLL
ncbi:unnamed protein product [Ostreobium quekettii]|uniref:Uncharacterized protein n=1 Tax=Ostreobium quekettii TaxID=121088 RepID=A0A8S1IYQ6_9CHLO|nr:unnamed protein product [Ostreobium quekettii]